MGSQDQEPFTVITISVPVSADANLPVVGERSYSVSDVPISATLDF